MSDTVILDGELSLMNLLDGELESVVKVGHDPIIKSLSINENGSYSAPTGVDGYGHIEVFVPPWSDELYPIGTDLVLAYVGRNLNNGNGLFVHGIGNKTTGEIIQTDDPSHSGFTLPYIPIDPNYTYYKTDKGRVYTFYYYDADLGFIGEGTSQNNLNFRQITNIPANARYVRFSTSNLTNNWGLAIFRTA